MSGGKMVVSLWSEAPMAWLRKKMVRLMLGWGRGWDWLTAEEVAEIGAKIGGMAGIGEREWRELERLRLRGSLRSTWEEKKNIGWGERKF